MLNFLLGQHSIKTVRRHPTFVRSVAFPDEKGGVVMAFLPFRDRARIVLFRWPAVIAGLAVALGIHIVLTAFGPTTAVVTNRAGLTVGT